MLLCSGGLALNGAGGKTGDDVSIREDCHRDDWYCRDRAGCGKFTPGDCVWLKESSDTNGHGCSASTCSQRETHQELIPGHNPGKYPSRCETRLNNWKHHTEECS